MHKANEELRKAFAEFIQEFGKAIRLDRFVDWLASKLQMMDERRNAKKML